MGKKTRRGRNNTGFYFARAARAGRADLAARTPELASLNQKKVTMVGLGCLGAPSALEFARCGIGEVRIIDYDTVEAGTIVRWPFGLKAVGRHKTEVIRDFCREHYPFTRVVPYAHRIGQVRLTDKESSEFDILEAALSDTNLIYDASAERGVQYLLSDLAAELRIPYISVSTTYGAWGGQLVRVHPRRTQGCWMCLMHSLDDGSIPSPASDQRGEHQPAGCADPTFTGASFDTAMIALGGVRLAVSTLAEEEAGGYPNFDWDVAVVNLRNEEGKVIPPSWRTFQISKHHSCGCAAKAEN
ncbi:MAG: ThiF family adenylyltransferase [Thermodesulfobacteriota bacterium]